MSSDALMFPAKSDRGARAAAGFPLDVRLLCTTPRRVSDVSAWIQHIPFAFALVDMLRPRRIVELGTHKGDSYCALCQAVDMLHLKTSCTAVDTWVGDAQSGTYGEDVLIELRAHHDPLYAGFSTLMRTTFDDAAGEVGGFEDGSIDLLHLDGLHHYAAVRHDFEMWRRKLSDRAVVMLHDTNVRHGDFGVYRLWEELRPHFPHFEFEHGCGLGVLAVGNNPPAAFQHFLAAAARDPEPVRQLCAALGQRLELSRGVAVLANDVVEMEARANGWRKFAGQPAREMLPAELPSTGLLEAWQRDTKALIDRAHEASVNHIDDLTTVTADNRNLRRMFAQLRERLAEQECAAEASDRGPDVDAVMGLTQRMVEERIHQRADLAAMRKGIEDLVVELRLGREELHSSRLREVRLDRRLRRLQKSRTLRILWRIFRWTRVALQRR